MSSRAARLFSLHLNIDCLNSRFASARLPKAKCHFSIPCNFPPVLQPTAMQITPIYRKSILAPRTTDTTQMQRTHLPVMASSSCRAVPSWSGRSMVLAAVRSSFCPRSERARHQEILAWLAAKRRVRLYATCPCRRSKWM